MAKANILFFELSLVTKAVGKGNSLTTIYGGVKRSEGSTRVHSVEGQGTAFQIGLPRVREATSSASRPEAQENDTPSGSETILLVEDDVEIRKLARRVLERQGYTLLVAQDGQAAWQMASRHTGPIHLLLTDVIMPGMNGRVLADRLTEAWPKLKVLFMSGYADRVLGHHDVLGPGVAFLQKPFRPVSLVRKVRAVLDS